MFSKWRRRAPIDDEERTPLLSAVAGAPRALADSLARDDDTLVRFGAALGALRAGRLPSTKQLCAAIQTLLDSDLLLVDAPAVVQPSRFSAAGRQVILDLRTLLEAIDVVLKAKNGASFPRWLPTLG
jgi:hypothetical protein